MGRGGGGDRGARRKFAKFCTQPLLHKSLTTKQPKKKQKNDISKQLSKQSKTGEVERNYKMFANPVFINPGSYIFHTFPYKF